MPRHNLPFRLIVPIFSLFIFVSGCGGGGGSGHKNPENTPVDTGTVDNSNPQDNNADDDNDDSSQQETADPFSVDSYTETVANNQSLSGIWMMVMTHKSHEYFPEDLETTDRTHKRRALHMIVDSELIPGHTPQLSDCSANAPLAITANQVTFERSGWIYEGIIESNTRISGTYREKYPVTNSNFEREITEASFTLIKIAALPDDFPAANLQLDEHNVAAYSDSFMAAAPSFGTLSINLTKEGQVSQDSGPVTCFSQFIETFTISTPSSSQNGRFTMFWAGRPDHIGINTRIIERDQQKRWDIDAKTRDNPYFSTGNMVDNETPGDITLSMQGVLNISAQVTALGTPKGDIDATVAITLP